METFKNLNYWLNEIEKHSPKDVYKILVGTKCDLEDKREVSIDQGREFATKFNMKFYETSAKESTNISELFNSLTREAIKRKEVSKNFISQDSNTKILSNNKTLNKNKKKCI